MKAWRISALLLAGLAGCATMKQAPENDAGGTNSAKMGESMSHADPRSHPDREQSEPGPVDP